MIITGALSGSKVTSPNLVQPGAVKCTPIVVYYAATTQLNARCSERFLLPFADDGLEPLVLGVEIVDHPLDDGGLVARRARSVVEQGGCAGVAQCESARGVAQLGENGYGPVRGDTSYFLVELDHVVIWHHLPTVASSPQSRGWLSEGPVGGERSEVRHDLVDVELHALPGLVDRHAAAERVEVEGGQLAHLLGASDDLVGREDLIDPLGP
jgi:hypothetical protein